MNVNTEDLRVNCGRLGEKAADELTTLRAEAARLREALGMVDTFLTNLQPHISQSCYPGRWQSIDNYVGPALEVTRAALAQSTTGDAA